MEQSATGITSKPLRRRWLRIFSRPEATILKANNKGAIQRNREFAVFMDATVDEIAFGQSTTLLLRTLGHALWPKMNGDSEMIGSLLDHETNVTSWLAFASSLGIATGRRSLPLTRYRYPTPLAHIQDPHCRRAITFPTS
ncbi:hypothetical protein P153DRAFT_391338 [Dothidotthia symphoricarpi CBS 119687]|uniref:Uncharacterized protein n=1 Tax=Dothidotthia symphoricarpi CBS 119687 TaxID=1392245 RepID=A0A6A5ZZ68_9PLEO|nr:uncharacterized protein P153DRAFT_391338 [Dothidotthia symphoricarpi CBS 119687]KAF2123611.1 hypothetical protein P153DRAFT_391338 [Dothidotthia symphoricarpi CBS 119687]